MPQDVPPRSDPPAAPPPAAAPFQDVERAASVARGPERLAVDIALHLGLLALFAWLALELIRPFGALLVWTVVIAAALHPIFGWLAARLGGRPRLAATLVTVAALLVVLGPIALLTASLVESVEWLTARARSGQLALPDPPKALIDLPGVGSAIASNWDLAASNLEGFLERYARTLLGAGELAVRPAIRFAEGTAIFLGAVALSGFLHISGEALADALRRFTSHVLGPRNGRFVDIASATIRNVARGVIGVAVIQALLIGVALIVAGVPAAGVLTLVTLVLAIVQIGAMPVVLPVIVWAWFERDPTTAALLAAYLLPAGLLDIPLKPLMLGKALTTPPLVIVAGVIAGAVAYGLIGLFLGPIVLAIAYEVAKFGIYGDPAAAPGDRGGIE